MSRPRWHNHISRCISDIRAVILTPPRLLLPLPAILSLLLRVLIVPIAVERVGDVIEFVGDAWGQGLEGAVDDSDENGVADGGGSIFKFAVLALFEGHTEMEHHTCFDFVSVVCIDCKHILFVAWTDAETKVGADAVDEVGVLWLDERQGRLVQWWDNGSYFKVIFQMLQGFSNYCVSFSLSIWGIDEKHPAGHRMHVDILCTNVHVNDTGIKIVLIALHAKFI